MCLVWLMFYTKDIYVLGVVYILFSFMKASMPVDQA